MSLPSIYILDQYIQVIVLTNLNKKFIVFDILVPVLIEKISDILDSLNLLNTDKLHPHFAAKNELKTYDNCSSDGSNAHWSNSAFYNR